MPNLSGIGIISACAIVANRKNSQVLTNTGRIVTSNSYSATVMFETLSGEDVAVKYCVGKPTKYLG